MRLKIEIGSILTKVIPWYRDLLDFPHLVRYNGSIYEWVVHEQDPTGDADTILRFGRCYSYTLNYYDIPDFDQFLNSIPKQICVCGAKHTTFKQFHMQFCSFYKDPNEPVKSEEKEGK